MQSLAPASALLLTLVTLSEAADDAGAAASRDKQHYTLFNPTPKHLMREMSTDRPDTTESPFTVDAGHVQVELSFADYTINDDHGIRTSTLAILPTNLKVGLLNNVDIQFVFTPYVRESVEFDGTDDDSDGFSDDTQIRLKFNLWGNDEPGIGNTSFAIMPFIKFPTGTNGLSNDHVEGGVILPLAIALPNDFSLGLMAEIDAIYNEATGDYGVNFVHTATISHDIPGVDNLAAYIEYIGVAPYDTGSTYQAIASGGFTYALNDDWIIDFGGTLGISESADDASVFIGTSFRF